jgi:hypothetical protein
MEMHRTRVKGSGIKAASSPSTEPDFYQMIYSVPRYLSSISHGAITDPHEDDNEREILSSNLPDAFSCFDDDDEEDEEQRQVFHFVASSYDQLSDHTLTNNISSSDHSDDKHNLSSTTDETDSGMTDDSATEYALRLDDNDQRGSSTPTNDHGTETFAVSTSSHLPPIGEPYSGEICFFEGKPFCYLEHLDWLDHPSSVQPV